MNDDDLRAVLGDAVSDVEPTDRLGDIRKATTTSSRRGWYAAGSAALLAAAAVATVAVVVSPDDGQAPDPDVAAPSTAIQTSAVPTTPPPSGETTAVYYLGPGPTGPDARDEVLYRYFEAAGSPLDLLTRTPSDPDYRTLWPEGAFEVVSDPEAGMVFVTLADASLHDRPAGMTEAAAELAIQQVIYTMQAYAKERVAVQFAYNGNPIDQVYGVPTSEPLTNAPQLDVLSHMSISDPAEGEIYQGSFTARGASNGFEASVYCQIVDGNGTAVWGEPTIAEGYMEPRLFAWELEVDLTDIPPANYTFTCTTDDPSGGAGGRGADVDTRSIVVR